MINALKRGKNAGAVSDKLKDEAERSGVDKSVTKNLAESFGGRGVFFNDIGQGRARRNKPKGNRNKKRGEKKKAS
jgi:hypothetical protein